MIKKISLTPLIIQRLGLLFLLAAVLQACAGGPACSVSPASPPKTTGTKPVLNRTWWERPDFDWHAYQKVMLDPVKIQIDAEKIGMTPEDLEGLSEEFTAIVIKTLGPEVPVVKTAGPDVLSIRATVTDLNPSNPVVNGITTLVVFIPLDMGGASVDVTLSDSRTQAPLAHFADRKTGTPLQLASAFSRYGHARRAVREWAIELKNAIVTKAG